MGLFYSMYYAGGTVVPALCGWAADLYGGPEGALLAALAQPSGPADVARRCSAGKLFSAAPSMSRSIVVSC